MSDQNESLLFSRLGLNAALEAVVEELGFKQMTPIQAQSIPFLLKGRDLVGQSKTGSGKTAAFALPILNKLNLETRVLQAMILCPTRELCAQVARDIRRLGRRFASLQVLLLVGGQPGKPQAQALEKGVHIVVGTPGRVLDHITRAHMDFSALSTLVLDEADRMLDMGFEIEMQSILAQTPRERQTVLFSATFPPEIKNISRKYQTNPAQVKIEEPALSENNIDQFFCPMETEEKQAKLIRFLRKIPGSALIFCNQKLTVAQIADQLKAEGLAVNALHGDLEQRDRDQVLALFRNGTTQFLVATDVAARGLDIADLDLVVNFEAPFETETYVHRIGRTGRAGKKGLALTLATELERQRLREIAAVTGAKILSSTLDKIRLEQLPDEEAAAMVAMRTVLISGGRKDKLRPGDILGALTGEAGGLLGNDIGKIEIHDHFSYVAINRSKVDIAISKLKAGRIKGRRFPVKILE